VAEIRVFPGIKKNGMYEWMLAEQLDPMNQKSIETTVFCGTIDADAKGRPAHQNLGGATTNVKI